MKKKLVLMTTALMAITLLAGCNATHTHDWSEVTYTWSADNATCTAERVCKGDESHKETEVANSTYNVVSEAKCEEDGTGRYSVTFENEAFTAQTKDVTLEAIGHEWGEVTYTWSDDYSSCTATRVCKNDSNHIESETASSAYTVTLSPTCNEEGTGVYDVAFEKEFFEAQSHEVTLSATGHDLIAHDAHAETCTEAGNTAYWSCERCGKFFSDEEGKNEIENNSWIIPTHAHDLEHHEGIASSCQTDGNLEYWTCNECHQYFLDAAGTQLTNAEAVVVPAHHTLTHHEAKEATRLEAGNIEYWSCDVCGKYFSDEEGKNEIDAQSITIPALGTNKSYFKNATYSGSDRYLYFYLKQFDDYKANCIYSFNDFNYNDETKELSFIITKIKVIKGEAPYQVGDTISFTYDAEKDVLMYGTVKLSRSSS